MTQEALKLALEALITITDAIYVNSQQEANAVYKANDAITAIKKALARPEEPETLGDGMPTSETERHLRRMLCFQRHGSRAYMDDGEASWSGGDNHRAIDYMREAPQAIEQAWHDAGLKNFDAAVQKLTATQDGHYNVNGVDIGFRKKGEVLYTTPAQPAPVQAACKDTTPPQRKPLTDEQIGDLKGGYQSGRIGSFVELIRAVEAAHGIKGET